MKGKDKGKEQLSAELDEAFRRIAELERVEEEYQRAEEELQRYRGHLEELVEDRTAELTHTVARVRQLNERLEEEIAERERIAQALRESEERYRRITEAVTDYIFTVRFEDDQPAETIHSPTSVAVTGYSSDEFAADHDLWIRMVPHEDHPPVLEQAARILSGEEAEPLEHRIVRKDGTTSWVRNKTVPHHDAQGRLLAYDGLIQDVTERKQAEEALRQQTAQLEALRQVGLEITAQLDLKTLLHSIIARAIELLGGDSGGFVMYQPDQSALEWSVTIDLDVAAEQVTIQWGEGLAGRVWATGEPLIVENYARWEGHLAALEYSVAIVGVPVRWGEEFFGVLEVVSRPPRTFTPADAELLSLLATQAAIAIRNVRLYDEVRRRGLEQETVRRVTYSLNTLDLQEAFPVLVEGLRNITRCDAVSLSFLDETGERFELSILEFPAPIVEEGSTLPISDIAASQDVLAGRAHVVADLATETDFLVERTLYQAGFRSRIALPLLVGGRTIGVLDLFSIQPASFQQDRLPALQQIADALASAAENSRLYAEQRRRAEEASTLLEITNAITSTLELDDVLKELTLRAARACGANRCTIFLFDERSETLLPIASQYASGKIDPQIWRLFKEASYPQATRDAPALFQVLRERRPLFSSDAPSSSLPQEWIETFGVGSLLIVPLISRERVVAMMTLDWPEVGRTCASEQVNLAMTIGGQAAVAIENARLHQELHEHAEQLEQRVRERTAELQVQYARLDAILRSTTDGIFVTNDGGEIIQANPVAQTWLNRSLSPEEAARLREAVRSVATRPAERSLETLELTGLDLALSGAPITEAPEAPTGEPMVEEPAAVVAAHDVSHLKAVDRMKTHFISNVSHELRTPVTTIKLYGHLLERTPPDSEKWAQYLDALNREADHQAHLVEDILQISRIDSGRLEMAPQPSGLNTLTDAVVAGYEALARGRGLALEHHPAEPGPMALVDPERIKQALDNLVENAIHYTPEGGAVTVSTGTERAEGRTWATATVIDTGMGIPEEELPYIFDRFFRGEKPCMMQLSGTGLGLAITKEIVELHGGRMTVKSEEGVGSSFTVWLPLADS